MKKILTLPFILILFTLPFWGCEKKQDETAPKESNTSLTAGTEIDSQQLINYSHLLGCSDREVTDLWGLGEPAYPRGRVNAGIDARLYQKNVLGFTGETVLVFDEGTPPRVKEVLITFSSAQFVDLVDGITQQLGEAVQMEKNKTAGDYGLWLYADTSFTLTYFSGTLLLTITASQS